MIEYLNSYIPKFVKLNIKSFNYFKLNLNFKF